MSLTTCACNFRFAWQQNLRFAIPIIFLSIWIPSIANADFVFGDVYIVGWHGDVQESVAFVIFEEMAAGEQIFFTDSGFLSSGDLRGTETVMTWTATSDVAAGTVVTITNSAMGSNGIADQGTVVGELDLQIDGDQIFVGSTPFPTANPGSYDHNDLIFGFDYNTTAGWDTTATGPRTSALPSTLTEHNVAFDHIDNGVYVGPRTGLTVSQYQSEIKDSSNWSFSNARADIVMNSTDFQVVPEPVGASLITLIVAFFFVRRRR